MLRIMEFVLVLWYKKFMDENKNVLVIAGSSQIGIEAIRLMLDGGYRVYATSRNPVDIEDKNLLKYALDVTDDTSFCALKEKLSDVKFCAVINNAGIAIASPVEFLDESELQKQLDVNLFGLLRVIKHFSSCLVKEGKIINISSMASYGVYPFLSPYCLSKRAADILLRSFSNEAGIKYVSIRPGAIRTKFWTDSIEQNRENFEKFTGKYENIGKYMLDNARKNSLGALEPAAVGRAVFKVLNQKNPKCVINVGLDAHICAFASKFLSEDLLNKFIRMALKLKSRKANEYGK